LNGSFSIFDNNAKVLSSGAYSDNKPSGVWLTYYDSFKVKSELSYNPTGNPLMLFFKYDGDLYSGQLTDIMETQGIQRVMQIKNGVLNHTCPKRLEFRDF
jgi:antitoxin component YwqK of YwqJK toxin-antitoxin module